MGRKITKWDLLMPFLSDYRRHVILADMERELGVPHQTLRKYATELVKDGILLEERKPKNIVYSLNSENHMVLNYISSAEKVVLENALDKSSLLKRLYEVLSPYMIITDFMVFGSFAKSLEGKDIDFIVVGGNEKVERAKEEFEKTYGKHIHSIKLEKFPPDKTMLKELIKKHIMLNGFDMFVKSFWEFAWKG